MIQVVLDTNIVVSALLRSGSLPEAAFNLAMDRVVQLSVSESILTEYEDVLRRSKLRIHPDKVTLTLKRIREVSLLIRPAVSVTVCSDPDDNIFLECSEAAQANYLVTGNVRHFPDVWATTQIVTPREFFQVIVESQHGS
ncbi:MAG TPA: putative toxin-antitoxin system toxin component, PIN family [Candidatus Angelobacter sp.]|jgi:putative PIN family toxin of toxin-antitoxin system|nr:putative toxin-antitoxin system toxin component, PIN family [Candidatus Angelobacter sp.]